MFRATRIVLVFLVSVAALGLTARVALCQSGPLLSMQIERILPGDHCNSGALSPDGTRLIYKAWFAEWDEGLLLVDAETYEIISEFHTYDNAWLDVWFSADGQSVWITEYYGGFVTKMDLATGELSPRIDLGSWTFKMVMNAARTFLYAGENHPGTDVGGSIQKIDLATESVVASVALGGEPNVLNLSPAEDFLYFYTWNEEKVYKISTADLSIAGTQVFPGMGGDAGLSVSRDGSLVYLADSGADVIHVLSADTLQEQGTISVPAPDILYVSPWGDYGLVTSAASKTVTVVGLPGGEIGESLTLPVGESNYWSEQQAVWDEARNKVYIPVRSVQGGLAVIKVGPCRLSVPGDTTITCETSVPVTLKTQDALAGVSLALSFDPAIAELVEIEQGALFDTIGAPDVWEAGPVSGSCEDADSGVQIAIIVSGDGSRTIPPGEHEIARLVLRRDIQTNGLGCTPTALAFRDACLGSPPVSITCSTPDGDDIVPLTQDGTLYPGHACFIRGDANSNGQLTISDAVKVIAYRFLGAYPVCQDAADADDDGTVDIVDAIYLVNYLFRAGPECPAPFPEPGPDPTDDSLGCDFCE